MNGRTGSILLGVCDWIAILFSAAGVASSAAFLLRLASQADSPRQSVLVGGLILSASLLLPLARKLPANGRIGLGLVLCFSALSLYAVEIILTNGGEPGVEARKRRAALESGRSFDSRSPYQVMAALREAGKAAYPALFPRKLLRSEGEANVLRSPIAVGGREVVPVSGVPSVTTVHCNESGAYAIYESDEFGFRNPNGLWPRNRLDLALIGDSFLHGDCVGPGSDVASRLRQTWPLTVTLGMRNNGPLLELAGLIEFLPKRKPANVVWFFYEGNDWADLTSERLSPVLGRYLSDPGVTQGLEDQSGAVGQALRAYLELLIEVDQQREGLPSGRRGGSPLVDVLLLRSLRSVFGLSTSARDRGGWEVLAERLPALRTWWTPPQPSAMADDGDQLMESLFVTARQSVKSWGGRLIVVYLPDPVRLCQQIAAWQKDCPRRPDIRTLDEKRKSMRELMRRLAIPFHDFTDPLGEAPGADRLFFYYGSHFSETGYAWLAEMVKAALETQP